MQSHSNSHSPMASRRGALLVALLKFAALMSGVCGGIKGPRTGAHVHQR